MAFRSFKETACTRKVKRLLIDSALKNILHPCINFVFIALLKLDCDTGNDKILIGISTATVRKAKHITGKSARITRKIEMIATDKNVLHLAAVGTCIHICRTACRTGNTISKLKTA